MTRPVLFDVTCKVSIGRNVSNAVSWYLMAAYAYYIEDNPILSDAMFDDLAKLLAARWGEIEHQHKHLITLDDLSAGTLLIAKEQYPQIVLGALKTLRR